MPAAEGDWVRQHVLPAGYLRNSAPIERCACQSGICGGCARGDHARCLVRQWQAVDPATRPDGRRCIDATCETHIVSRSWMVASTGRADHHVSAEVWRTGRPCRYRCPCPCPAELHPALPAAPRPRRDAGGNAAATLQGATDRQSRAAQMAIEQPTLDGLAVTTYA